MDHTESIAVFVGSSASINIRHVLNDIEAMVPGTHHLITTDCKLADSTNYLSFGAENHDTLFGGIQALSEYLNVHDPRFLLQITDPPLHGTIAGSLANRHDVPFVYRYSGDRFYEYRVARGRERFNAFALGSVLGRVPIRLAARHIALGPAGKRRLVARGVPSQRITILPPAVDPTQFDGSDPISLDVPDDRKLVLFVGRVSHLKGVETLERVIPSVVERRDDLQFVCVGNVERDLDVPKQVQDHVMSVGKVPPDTVSDYMSAADLLLHPTLTEGVPRVLLESLAAGTPVLARDVGDVASVTDNTFDSDKELKDRLTNLEAIPFEDVSPFTQEHLETAYRDFFGDCQQLTFTEPK